MQQAKIIRITTVPLSLKTLLKGQMKFMSQNGFEVVAISSNAQEMEEVAKAENIRVANVEMTRKITPIQDLKALFQLIKIFRKERPDIVHTHTPKAGLLGMLAAKITGVPHRLHTVAGLPLIVATGIKRKVLNFTERLTYTCAHQVYPNSFGLQKIIEENKFCPTKKLKVIGNGSSNGIDTDHFSREQVSAEELNRLSKDLSIQKDDIVFIFVGRVVQDKGINELIAAFKNIHEAHSNTKLIIVGPFESDLNPILPETMEAINQHQAIKWVGFQKDVRPYLALAHCLAFPSYREGFPNVVMQAGAMGLFSIVTDINGCNEIIEDGKNGIIIPVKNTGKLEDAMHNFILNKNKQLILSQLAREVIVNRYEQQYIWQKILNEYQTLLHQS